MAGMIVFTPTEQDYVAASRAVLLDSLLSLKGALVRWIIPLCVIALAAFLIVGRGAMMLPWVMTAAGAIVIFGVPALNFVLIPGSVRRMIAKRPNLTREIRFTWGDAGIEAASATGTSRLGWPQLRRWLQGAHGFALLSGKKGMLIVPADALDAAQAADLRATLVAHGARRR
jgi:hypothetical protein